MRLHRTVTRTFDLFDYTEAGLESLRPHPKARDRWKKTLWADPDGIGKAPRSSGWKSHKARKQWEHNVRAREKKARKATHRANGSGPPVRR